MRAFPILILFLVALTYANSALAQFGVCNRWANHAAAVVNSETQQKIQYVLRHNYPPHVIQAHLNIIDFSQQDAMRNIQIGYNDCARGFKRPQQIVDSAMFVFTAGLNRALPPGMTRIDMSEFLSGRSFGGPTAIIPQMRERVLRGDRGTVSNFIRDPIRCLMFMRKC